MSNPTAYRSGENIETSFGQIILGPNVGGVTPRFFAQYVYLDDGGAFTDYSAESQNLTADDINLLPAAPAAEDAIYIGSDVKFERLNYDETTAGAGTWTITWEIYEGGSWSSANITASTAAQFQTDSLLPWVDIDDTSSWTTTTINGQEAYWIRARLSSFTSLTTQPKAAVFWTTPVAPATEIYAQHVIVVNGFFELYWDCRYISCNMEGTYKLFADIGGIYMYQIWEAPSRISSMAWYDSKLFIALNGATYYYYDSYDTFTESTLTDNDATIFIVTQNVTKTDSILWKADANEIASSSNPVNGGEQWTSPAYVGDGVRSSIETLMLSPSGTLLVGLDTGLIYEYNSDGGLDLLYQPNELSHAFTGLNGAFDSQMGQTHFQNNLYFITENSVLEITSYGSIREIGPLNFPTESIDATDYWPFYSGITSNVNGLYIAVTYEGPDPYTDNYTVIYKSKPTSDGVFNWSPLVKVDVAVAALWLGLTVSSSTMLYWNNDYDFGTAALLDNPLATGSSNTTGGYLRTSYDYGTHPNWDKIITSVIIETAGCSDALYGASVSVSYLKDEDTTATEIVSTIDTNGIQKIDLSTPITGKRFSYEIHLDTDTSGLIPTVRYFEVLGVEKPTLYRLHQCVYKLGADPDEAVKTIRDFLRGGRTTTDLIKFADLRFDETTSGTAGTNYYYVTMESEPQIEEIYNEKTGEPDLAIRVTFRETNFT